ncbi:hypothetical protein OB920_17785 [Halobacteria archaeon HArc-gm2]|nr:hypothetical protein [Halobacteria archaeon HArc-gm2]
MTPPANDSGLADGPFRSKQFTPAELDELFDVLADARRRCTLQSLSDAGGTASFDELVGDVARQTVARPIGREQRREIATTLYHVHLPKLASAGLVADFDPDGEVALAEQVDDVPHSLFE